MKLLTTLALFATTCAALHGVYAPIPEAEKGKLFSATLVAGVSHDTNIFGAATGAIESTVWRVAPSISVNASLTDRTFFIGGYDLAVDYFENRPGNKELVSHNVYLRLAHAFSPRTTLDVTENFQISRNPESLLAGVPVNTDQSFQRNQLDGRLNSALSERLSLEVKARHVLFDYDNATLANDLDRAETLLGLGANYQLRPEWRIGGEYRYQGINYQRNGGTKDKDSHFLLAGANYQVGEKLSASARAGLESRDRAGGAGEDAPYVELSGRYAYGARSFLAGGYVYTLEETSNVALYTDTAVNRWFVNVQHALSAQFVVSGSFNYEPSVLRGRAGVAGDQDETTVRYGVAATWLPDPRWALSATIDRDDVSSDDPNRDLERTRFGVSGRRVF